MGTFFSYFLGKALKPLIYRTMQLLGLGLVSFTGSQVILDQILSIWMDYANRVPPEWISLLGYLNVDKAFSLILSALTIRFAIIAFKKGLSFRFGV